ncbi:MAG: hypothetical protein ABIR35_01750 [Polaromonas sp.]
MKKSFHKSLIAASVGAVMLAAAGTASANSLLFPYFTTNAGAQSVLSLSNTGTTPASEALHYVYNYGPTCTHYDANGSMTANDILSHSIAAPAAGGFGKVVGSDTSTPVYFPLANQTGFLVVSNKTTASADALRGSMAIVDPATGLVVSYAGIDNGLPTNVTPAVTGGEGDFKAIVDLKFPLTTMPAAIVSTSWYGVVVGDMSGVIATGANWPATIDFSNNGNVYNNDEVAYSGTTSKKITCAGSIVASDLATSAQAAAVGTNGGLVKVTGTPALGGTGAVLMKMQAVQAAVGAPFAGKMFLHREQAGL